MDGIADASSGRSFPFENAIATLMFHSYARVLLFLGVAAIAGESNAAPRKIDDEMRRRLSERGAVCICVELSTPLRNAEAESLQKRCERYERAQRDFLKSLGENACRVRYRYRYSPAVVVDVASERTLDAIERSVSVRKVFPEMSGGGGLADSVQLMRADVVHTLGFLGEGRVAAVLDSGVDSDHSDLADAIIHQYHFLDQGADTGPGAEDEHGHGTHVTGIIASRGNVAPIGIAPAVKIVSVRVLDRNNQGWFSDWAAGVEHVIDLHLADNGIEVDAINMSLRGFELFPEHCDNVFTPLSLACASAQELGIGVFACSGQSNVGFGSTLGLNVPGCFSSTTAVGAVPRDFPDTVSPFIHRNEFLDLLAPGGPVTSTGLRNGTRTFNGCSQATAHATALACLVREVVPNLDPSVLTLVMREYGASVFDVRSQRFYPRIDAEASIAAVLSDCNENGESDLVDLHLTGVSSDCNVNGVPDECDLALGLSTDEDSNGVPDECFEDVPFNRGDATADGVLGLADGMAVVGYLFSDTVASTCRDAFDGNNDGRIDLSDAIYILVYMFAGGPAPAQPGPPDTPCGFDTEGDGDPRHLGCRRYPACAESE